jgi:hypothetical protein
MARNIYIIYNKILDFYAVNLRNQHSMDTSEPERFKTPAEVIKYLTHSKKISLGSRKYSLMVSRNTNDFESFKGLEKKIKDLTVSGI